MLLTLALIALSVRGATRVAQELPVLEARSPVLDVEDGGHLWKGLWTADPSVALDVYHAKRSGAARTVTFRSDAGALELAVGPGEDADFVVRLADGRECRTRVSTERRPPVRASGAPAGAREEIPFRVEQGWMIVTARVNGSEPLDLMFDTGADNLVLFRTALAKGAGASADGSIENAGLGGTVTRSTSSDNRLSIGDLVWEHELALLNEGEHPACDGILGYVAFEDAVLEIDFDRGVLVRHATRPEPAGWTPVPMRYQGTIFALEAGVDAGPDARAGTRAGTRTGWFVYDTGSSATLHVDAGFAAESGVDALDAIGTSQSRGTGPGVLQNRIVLLPGLALGPHGLAAVPAHVEIAGQEPGVSSGNLLGTEVLARFGALIDFPRAEAFVRPSARFGEAFARPWRRAPFVIGGAGLAVLLVVALRRQRRARGARSARTS
jgi:hypothetical protein